MIVQNEKLCRNYFKLKLNRKVAQVSDQSLILLKSKYLQSNAH